MLCRAGPPRPPATSSPLAWSCGSCSPGSCPGTPTAWQTATGRCPRAHPLASWAPLSAAPGADAAPFGHPHRPGLSRHALAPASAAPVAGCPQTLNMCALRAYSLCPAPHQCVRLWRSWLWASGWLRHLMRSCPGRTACRQTCISNTCRWAACAGGSAGLIQGPGKASRLGCAADVPTPRASGAGYAPRCSSLFAAHARLLGG